MNLPMGVAVKRSSSPSVGNGRQETPQVARKVPIIRKPGEVVTPNRKLSGVVKVSPSTVQAPTLVRPKVEWSRVPAPGLKTPLSSFTITSINGGVQQDVDENRIDPYTQEDEGTQDPDEEDSKQLLERIVAKQGQHDAALKALKFNISDLRADMRSTVKTAKPKDSGSNDISFRPIPVKRDRKRLVVFPVADDNYLLRLDDLLKADEEIRTDLIALFGEAPTNSAYEFLRKNVQLLFAHTSKYTWTGKLIHHLPNIPASNPANKLAIVDLLISCGCDKFPHMGRDAVEKEFRRSLANFNESRVVRLKRQMEKPTAETMDEGENSMGQN
ncbi:AAEL013003-PA [Aedes aegypti]|uniref:AAEL013003-PA n=1 Tax=Aedes aegypti TaxID=7159 RepID=Q16KG4_AEDAE|nr:AAEL013003-PA [Aedes aegypti]